MAILNRFLSSITNKIETSFFCLLPVHEITGENMFNILNEEIIACGQDLSNCIGFAADGANVMMGNDNSVWSRVKLVSPNCLPFKCVCNSLALCVQLAVRKLPATIGFMLTEIPGWFCNSYLRREAYKTLFQSMNPLDAYIPYTTPLPFEKTSSTRRLVRGKVMYNILVNWEELKAYFASCEHAQKNNVQVRYKARLLKDMLSDSGNLLYFKFVTPFVQEFEAVNAFFQRTNADPHDLYCELYRHHDSLVNRIQLKEGHEKPIERVDFGAIFVKGCADYLRENSNSQTAKDKINDIKERSLKSRSIFKFEI